MRRDEDSLVDIAHFARQALQIRGDMDRQSYLVDQRTQFATLYALIVVGEAVKRLSPEFRAQHPATPWRPFAGMRDRLIHHDDQVNLERLWTTIDQEIPALIA